MEKLHRRKFLEETGIAAVELDISGWNKEDTGFDVSISISDTRSAVDFFWSFPFGHQEGSRENFSAAVKFFDTLRILSEEAIDDITARWVNMKLGENRDEESYLSEEEEGWEVHNSIREESYSSNGEGTTGVVQEELDFDSPAATEEERE